MIVTGKVRVTKPAEEPLETMLFATPEGNLVVDDPNQQKLDLKVIDQGAGAATPAQLKQAQG